MILFISNHGESLPIAWRLLQEGADCGVYVHDPAYKEVHKGILQRIILADLKAAVRASDVIVFDGIRENAGLPCDKAMLKIFGLPGESSGVFGPVATKLAEAYKVIGCSRSTERLQIEELGPPVNAGLIREGWFNGETWAFFAEILEDKHMLNADYGLELACQQSTVRVLDGWPDVFRDIGPELKDCGYVGPVSCDVDGNVLSMNFRFDSLYALLSLWEGSLEDFFTGKMDPNFKAGYAATERITVPPYPYSDEALLEMAKTTTIRGEAADYPGVWFQDVCINGHGFACAGADGILGIASGIGKNINAAWAKAYKAVDTLRVDGAIQIRTDGPRAAERTLKKARKEGII